MEDNQLLGKYCRDGDQAAFAELVRLHGDWVYSTAKRQLGEEHLAEDVTQAVFALLARRAKRLNGYSYLGGWLFNTLRYCVKEARRQRSRQRKREQEAAKMRRETAEPAAEWEQIAPMLDEAVATLGKGDREAVLLRFYQQKALAEVGRALGVSEEAARKRVDRAVEKLRGVLAKKGVAAGAALGMVMTEKVTEAAPVGVMNSVAGAMGSVGNQTVAGAIAKGAMKMMMWAKVKVAVVAVAAASVAAVGTAEVVTHSGDRTAAETTAQIGSKGGAAGPATVPALSPAAAPTLTEVLTQYEHNSSHLRSVAISSSTRIKGESSVLDTQWEHRAEELRRDDQGRLQITTTSWNKLKTHDEETTPDKARTQEWIWDGKMSYSYVAYGASVGGGIPPRVRLQKDVGEFLKASSGSYAGAVLDGVFVGDLEPVRDILQKGNARLRDAMETINGAACYVIEGTSANGKHTVWLDSEHGYAIVKAEVRKSGDDLLNGFQMSAVSPDAKKYPGLPQGRLTTFVFSLTNVQLEKQGEAWVPMLADYSASFQWDDGRTEKGTCHHERTRVVIRPDFEAMGAFKPVFPNGIQVLSPDFGTVKFIWNDGKPVTK